MTSILPIILCGGDGTRLAPYSTPERPKPFLSLIQGATLLEHTHARITHTASENAHIHWHTALCVLQLSHLSLVQESLGTNTTLFLTEPSAKNTAPSILLACLWAQEHVPGALLWVLPADHYIPDPTPLAQSMPSAVNAALSGQIVTFGITPAGPESDYGYCVPPEPCHSPFSIKEFIEKPEKHHAATLIAQGALWNSGMFLFSPRIMLQEAAYHCPTILSAIQTYHAHNNVEPWDALTPLSIDYAILQQARARTCIPLNMAWHDLGTPERVVNAGLMLPSHHS